MQIVPKTVVALKAQPAPKPEGGQGSQPQAQMNGLGKGGSPPRRVSPALAHPGDGRKPRGERKARKGHRPANKREASGQGENEGARKQGAEKTAAAAPKGPRRASAPQKRRVFSTIIRVAPFTWKPHDVDYERHVAQGLLIARTGAYSATARYVPRKEMLILHVSFKWAAPNTPVPWQLLDRIEERSSLTRIIPDIENRLVHVHAASVCPTRRWAAFIFTRMLNDLLIVLDDSRLKDLGVA